MAEEQTKVEIGFGIGQVLSVKLGKDELADLRKAVETGKGWFDLRTQEGTVVAQPGHRRLHPRRRRGALDRLRRLGVSLRRLALICACPR